MMPIHETHCQYNYRDAALGSLPELSSDGDASSDVDANTVDTW